MNVKEYLSKVAYVGDSEIDDDDGEVYYSNFDTCCNAEFNCTRL